MPGKALPLLLSALTRLPKHVKWRLEILGAGPCTRKWKRRARSIGVDTNCRWLGKLPRVEALRVVKDSHLFVTTSLKDLTSTVIIEALAEGVPVICPNHCGFSDAIDECSGITLPIDTPRRFIVAASNAIQHLHDNEQLRRNLAMGALQRRWQFAWEVKARDLETIYAAKVGNARTRPQANRTHQY